MISHRPDPKNCGSQVPVASNPYPTHRSHEAIGKNLDQLQQDAPEQDRRFSHRLLRFLWS